MMLLKSFVRWDLSLAWNVQVQLRWLASDPWPSSSLFLYRSGITSPCHDTQLFFLDVGLGAQFRPASSFIQQGPYQVSCLLGPELYSFKWSRTKAVYIVQSLKDTILPLSQKTWAHFPASTPGGSKPPVTRVLDTVPSSGRCRYCSHIHRLNSHTDART